MVRKEKGASAKSAYHGHDCFGLKSTTFFAAFFHRRRYYYFQSLRLYQGYAYVQRASVVSSLSSLIAYRKGATTIARSRTSRTRREKICTYARWYISKPFVLQARLNAKRRMFYVRVHIFLPPSSEASPETFFLDSISRLPRDRIVEMARALFRVSCRKDEGAGCDGAYCPIPTCGKWKEPSNGERKTNRFSCENRIVFMRNPSMRMLARVERILIWIPVRNFCNIFPLFTVW